MNFNGPILEALFRWLRLDQQSMLHFPPGDPDRVLVVWALLLLEIYLLLWLSYKVLYALWPRAEAPAPTGSSEPAAEASEPSADTPACPVEEEAGPPSEAPAKTAQPTPPVAPAPARRGGTLRRVLFGMGLALLGAASFFGILETVMRSYVASQPPPNFIPHPLYMWRFGSNLRNFPLPTPVGTMYFDTNADGLRAKDVPATKEPGEVRIVVLGDSASFGQSVEFDQMYSQQLERLLGEALPGRKIRVINGSVPGYSILQGYYIMSRICMKYQPDLVIVNEFNEFSNRQVGEFDTLVPRSPLACTVKETLWSSMVYMTVRKMSARFTDPVGPGPPPPSTMQGPKLQMAPDEETVDYLQRFVNLFKKNHVKAIFVMWRRPGYWNDTFKTLLAKESTSQFLAVDYNRFLLQEHGHEFWIKEDPSHHPGPKGHLLMAECLRDTIIQNKLLGP